VEGWQLRQGGLVASWPPTRYAIYPEARHPRGLRGRRQISSARRAIALAHRAGRQTEDGERVGCDLGRIAGMYQNPGFGFPRLRCLRRGAGACRAGLADAEARELIGASRRPAKLAMRAGNCRGARPVRRGVRAPGGSRPGGKRFRARAYTPARPVGRVVRRAGTRAAARRRRRRDAPRRTIIAGGGTSTVRPSTPTAATPSPRSAPLPNSNGP
jgi:hypothetical protein